MTSGSTQLEGRKDSRPGIRQGDNVIIVIESLQRRAAFAFAGWKTLDEAALSQTNFASIKRQEVSKKRRTGLTS